MAETFSNSPVTNLTADFSNVATTLTVSSAASFPGSASFRIRIDNELLLVTGGAGTTTWTVTRGIEGTTAASHLNGATITHLLTAGALVQLKVDVLASISGTGPIAATAGVISIPAATTSSDGYMTIAQATQLANATATLTPSTIVIRDSSSNVTVNSINLNANEFLATQPYALIARNVTNGILRTFNPANLTAGAISGQANSATITASTVANGNQIALRDASGHIYANNFNMAANEYSGAAPYAIFGRNGGSDNFLRTFNPAALSVGYANNAGYSTNSGTSSNTNGLNGGTTDGDKVHGLNTSYSSVVTNGAYTWYKSYLPSGRRIYACRFGVGLPASPEAVIVNITMPDGIGYSSMSVQLTAGGDGAPQQIVLAARPLFNIIGNEGNQSWEIAARTVDAANLNTKSGNFRVNIIAMEL